MSTPAEVVDEKAKSSEVVVSAPSAPPNLTNLTFAEMNGLAKVFVASGAFTSVRDVGMALVKIVAGQERGIPPMQAMTGVHVIKGHAVLSAGLIGALVKRSGRYNYRLAESTAERCELRWYERGEDVGGSDFTIEQAKKAGLVKADSGWATYPEDMLFARALTRGARRYCPDVFGGVVYAEGEDIPDTADELAEPDKPRLPSLPFPEATGPTARPDVAEDASSASAEPSAQGSDPGGQGTLT